MVDHADLVMINTEKATTVELMTVMLHLGSKTWFYVDRDQVDPDVQILLNSTGGNVFNNSEQLHNMLRSFLSNG
jgi:ATP-dependent protease ClpP protease subunit